MMKGIDVSVHNGTIDWQKVRDTGIDFAILRAGYGRFESQKDTKFEDNYAGANAVGLPIGAYWYSYATTPDEAKQEAEVCISILNGKQFEYPIFFDLEEKSALDTGKDNCSAMVKTFCDTLENAGYYAGFYMSRSPLTTHITDEVQKRYALWIAEWNSTLNYSGSVGLWQFSSRGFVDGITGNVDLDIGYVEYPETIKANGLNGFPKPVAEEKAPVFEQAPPPPATDCLIVGIVCAVIAPNLRVQTPPTDTTISVSDTTAQSAETTTVTGKHSGVSVSGSISAVTSANADNQTDTNSATESTADSSLSAQGTESNVTTQTDPSQSVICTATTTTTKRTSSTTTTTRTTPTTTGTTRSNVTMVFSSEKTTQEVTDPGPQPTVYQYHVPAARTVKTETVPCEKTIVCEDFQAKIYRDGFPSGMDFDVDSAFDFSAYDCMLIRFRTSSEAAVVSNMRYNNYNSLRIYIPLFPNRQADTAQIFTMAVAVPKELHLSNSIEVMPCPISRECFQ